MPSLVPPVQPRLASSGGGKTNDEIVYDLAENILQRIPHGLDLDKAEESLFAIRILSQFFINTTHFCNAFAKY